MSAFSTARVCAGRSRQRRAAFTLIEILCVVVILGISAAVILPQVGNRDDLRAAAMARVLTADLGYIQCRAVSTQRRQYVRFDLVNNRYEVLDQLTPTEQLITHPVDQTPFVVPLGEGRSDNLKDVVFDTVSFDTHTILMFDELGAPYAYNGTTNTASALIAGSIVLRSNAYTLTITVKPFSGELQIN
jgi:prepilin-type N-terminal cleavage/methylation domain-containing protein